MTCCKSDTCRDCVCGLCKGEQILCELPPCIGKLENCLHRSTVIATAVDASGAAPTYESVTTASWLLNYDKRYWLNYGERYHRLYCDSSGVYRWTTP